jgi:hypothetical protein
MLGTHSREQTRMFDVGNVWDLELPKGSFYLLLAQAAPDLFADADFAKLYHESRGRLSVPPSQLALVLIMQTHDGVSDQEAIERTAFDLRWAAVLGKHAGKPLCVKSTLQLFRAQLILEQGGRAIFDKSLKLAKEKGLLPKALSVAIDTKPIFGRGAVEDTFNLVADGVRQLARAIAKERKQTAEQFLTDNELDRYNAPSVKGNADIDWSDEAARERLLTEIVRDARRILALVDPANPDMVEAASLLSKLLQQDVEETPGTDGSPTAKVKEGTTPGRAPSATDPEMRHGRKSASKRFDGHKASVAVDVESQIVVAVDVLAGDAPDQTDALELVKEAEAATEMPVSETLADCAYGGGPTREAFAKDGRTLIAKVPKEVSFGGRYPKSAFVIDPEADTVTCPAGHTVDQFSAEPDGSKRFSFGKLCASCPLRSRCTKSAAGRRLTVQPHERAILDARAYQRTPEGKSKLRSRVAVEHALARLSHLGIGQARYRGRKNTRFQLFMAAAVANLRLILNTTDPAGIGNSGSPQDMPAFRGPVTSWGRTMTTIAALWTRVSYLAAVSTTTAHIAADSGGNV